MLQGNDQSAQMGLDAPRWGLDASAHEWPRVFLYAVPPLELITPTLTRVRERGLIPDSPPLAREILAGGGISTPVWQAMASATVQGPPDADRQGRSFKSAFEWWCVKARVLAFQSSVPVILTFLLELLDFSTVKVYLAAILVCQIGFGDNTVDQHSTKPRLFVCERVMAPVSRPVAFLAVASG